MTYKQTAKELGIKYRIGKYGIQFGRGGLGRKWRFSIVPLDGWIIDPKEIERHFRQNGLEL